MKMRTAAAVVLSLLISLLFCGCELFTVDTAELLNTPKLSGDISPIAEAIAASAGGEYTLKYPSKGNYRSAVVQNDINSDGLLEAFAFYSITENETATMVLDVICNKDGKWSSAAQQKIVAGGVDKIEFCDLDNDGIEEILVGWEIYGASEMQLAVYSFKDGKITQRMLQKYSHFVCCDLEDDGKNEVFLIMLNSAEQINTASVYELTDSGVNELYSCELDPTVRIVNEPVVSHLSSGRPAVYIDEVKGVGAVTEVLFIEKNRLVNPLLNLESRETLATLRSVSLSVQDINGDDIIEIPVQENVPSVTKSEVNEKLYLTNWCSYNGETLTSQMTTMVNINDGYYYIISSKRAGQIAIYKDTDSHVREIYKYDNETSSTGELLIFFKTVKKSDWDIGKYKDGGFIEITHDDVSSHICRISDTAAEEGLTIEEVRRNFKLLE